MGTRPFDGQFTRRAALARLGGGGLGLALAARGLGTAAQDASPAAAPGAIPPLLAEWASAWTAHDADRVLALYAPDGVYVVHPVAETLVFATRQRGTTVAVPPVVVRFRVVGAEARDDGGCASRCVPPPSA